VCGSYWNSDYITDDLKNRIKPLHQLEILTQAGWGDPRWQEASLGMNPQRGFGLAVANYNIIPKSQIGFFPRKSVIDYIISLQMLIFKIW
jgi:hypothetical protein